MDMISVSDIQSWMGIMIYIFILTFLFISHLCLCTRHRGRNNGTFEEMTRPRKILDVSAMGWKPVFRRFGKSSGPE